MAITKLFLIALLLLVNTHITSGQTQSNVYDFPIRPGTPEWENLNTYKERLNAYNIPDSLLVNMSTSDLVQTCLTYPEFRLIMTRNSLQQGYDYLYMIFNGFRELHQREDAGKELLIKYKQLDPGVITSYGTLLEQGKFVSKFRDIEIMLSQRAILKNMTLAEKKELTIICLSNYEIKENLPDQYATFGLATTALILGRMLDVIDYHAFTVQKSESANIQMFIGHGYAGNQLLLAEIISIAKIYLNE